MVGMLLPKAVQTAVYTKPVKTGAAKTGFDGKKRCNSAANAEAVHPITLRIGSVIQGR